MVKDLDYYMNLNYKIEVVEDKEEGGYAFNCPDLQGCITCADTLQEGFKLIEDAKRSWFTACLEDSIPIPEPNRLEDYSGQFKLRIPKSLHKMLAERSRLEGISMNQYCLYLLSSSILFAPQKKALIQPGQAVLNSQA
jgi:predicted RNase H-like HicB family nuclease